MDSTGPLRVLDPATWERINDLVGEALDGAPGDRAAFLATITPEALATEVAALVEAHATAESTGALLSPFEAVGTPEADHGDRFGPYRILGRLGAGGMGVVYRAARADGAFDREVALKVVRHAAPTLARRFARERQALARLEHPHIARLYDAGVADDGPLGGTPYLAMERVEGEPITAYAERHRLGMAERVRLLLPVCEAVAYAHGRLVLHRDLKPSNVLVSVGVGGKGLGIGNGIERTSAPPSSPPTPQTPHPPPPQPQKKKKKKILKIIFFFKNDPPKKKPPRNPKYKKK
ncbi:MAG: protein kinase, partial [Bacteroidota bacterium]